MSIEYSHLVVMFVPDVAQAHQSELQYINQVLVSLTHAMNIPFATLLPCLNPFQIPEFSTFGRETGIQMLMVMRRWQKLSSPCFVECSSKETFIANK